MEPSYTHAAAVAAELRAIAGRQRISHTELARRVNRHPDWMRRRLMDPPTAALSVGDLTLIAAALSVTPAEVLAAAEEVKS